MSLIEQLRREEGVVPHAYQDHLGFWTIGVGRLIDKRKGGGLSDEEIDLLLRNDIAKFEREVKGALPWVDKLDPARQAVVIGMAFQMGTAGLLAFKRTIGFIEQGNYAAAAQSMLQSKWAQQTPARVVRLARQMETGQWTL